LFTLLVKILNHYGLCEISDTHGGWYEDDSFLGHAEPCSLVEVNRRFRDAYCLHHSGDEGSTHLLKVGILQQDYTALYPRRLSSSR